MFKNFEKIKNDFEDEFLKIFDNYEMSEILKYSISSGKRVRPILMIAIYKMLSKKTDISHITKYAIALELIHNYSLIHDDLPSMDNDNYRRGRETVHYKFGEANAILAGDTLLNFAYEILFDFNSTKNDKNYLCASKYLAVSSGILGMIKGQVLDIENKTENIDEIIEMYKNKTCKLIMAATTIPAFLLDLNDEMISEFEELGFNIGMAFQLKDDLLDLEEDLINDKKTLAVLYGEEKTVGEIEYYTDKAINFLNKFDENEELIEFVESLINREF